MRNFYANQMYYQYTAHENFQQSLEQHRRIAETTNEYH